MSLRQLSFALFATATVAACGGDGEETVVPEGTKYYYVVDTVKVPGTTGEASSLGLDLNDDGAVDNQLGGLLPALKSQGLDVQPTVTEAVNDGTILLLAEFQTKDFTNAAASGLSVFLGDSATIMPAACTNPADPLTCGKHLAGTGTFTISASSPRDAKVTGKVVNGTFTGGPGKISLSLSLTEGQPPIQLDLLGARAQLKQVTDAGIGSGIVGGAISKTDIDTKIIPAIHSQISGVVAAACMMPAAADCGCPTGSASQILGLFDKAPTKDCMVSQDEIKNSSIVQTALQPDVTIDGVQAVSIGLGVTAKKGTFTP